MANRLATAISRNSIGISTSHLSDSIGSGVTPTSFTQIPEGKYTLTIYSFIRDGRFQDVIKILSNELGTSPKNRAALSLLGYSYYQIQDFPAASDWYISSRDRIDEILVMSN